MFLGWFRFWNVLMELLLLLKRYRKTEIVRENSN